MALWIHPWMYLSPPTEIEERHVLCTYVFRITGNCPFEESARHGNGKGPLLWLGDLEMMAPPTFGIFHFISPFSFISSLNSLAPYSTCLFCKRLTFPILFSTSPTNLSTEIVFSVSQSPFQAKCHLLRNVSVSQRRICYFDSLIQHYL